jgi:hypothetical protein
MKRMIGFVVAASCFSVSIAAAGVNCEQVKKYLKTGRTPQDVADTMVIGIDEVKKCQGDAGAGAPAAGGTPAPGKAGSSAAPDGSKAH